MNNQIIIISLIIICLLIYYYYQNNQDGKLIKDLKQKAQSYQTLYQNLLKEKKAVGTQTDNLGIDKETQTNLPDPELTQALKEKQVINNELSLTKKEKEELQTKLTFLNKNLQKLKDDHKKSLEGLQKDNNLKDETITKQAEQINNLEKELNSLQKAKADKLTKEEKKAAVVKENNRLTNELTQIRKERDKALKDKAEVEKQLEEIKSKQMPGSWN